MTVTEKLDMAIKLKEKGSDEGAYAVSYKGETLYKSAYMTNAEWEAFLKQMSDEAKKEYGEGGGDELSEKNGCPPKMASYGSSSRMIYCLSRKKEGFHYEKKLSTTVGGKATLDGFYEGEDAYIFVEAKCREPYTAKKNSVSHRYASLYGYINERMASNLRIDMQTSKCGRYMNVDFFADGERLERFDLKQMICHLLGIATGMLDGSLKRKQVNFIYLLYDPTKLDVDDETKAEIDGIYERTCYECTLVDFAELFRAILEFLIGLKFSHVSDGEVDDLLMKFTFTLASQDFYPILIQ